MEGQNRDIKTAFDALVNQYGKLISSLCVSHTSFTDIPVDDLMQECLSKLWVQLHDFLVNSEPPPPASWVYWNCRDAISHYKRRYYLHQHFSIDTINSESRPDPSSSELSELLDYLARDLTPKEKKAFLLMAKGCTNLELAQTLHLSPASAKLLRHRIIKKIRENNPDYLKHKM